MGWTRRRFVRVTLASAGVLWLPACGDDTAAPSPHAAPSPSPAPAPSRPRILVVGAGMSGLAAAGDLVRRGAEVVVLEARDRIGGRIWTDRTFGFPLERGATWIHDAGGENPITPLARAVGSRTVVDDESARTYDADGRELSDDESDALDALGERATDRADALASTLDADLSIEAAMRRGADAHASAFDRRALDFTLATLETDLGGPLDRASLLYADDEDAQGYDGDDLVITDGYDRVVRAVAEGLDVRLAQTVTGIDARGGSVRVTTTSGQERADAVVVSVPLGVLRAGTIRFDPPLPSESQGAIDRLGMGTLDKVVLRFDRAFWPSDVQSFRYVSETRGDFPYVLSWQALAEQPVLVLFTGGQPAIDLERQPDEERVAAAMRVVRTCFGQSAPTPTGSIVTRWASDPQTLGSYSFVPLGGRSSDRAVLARPAHERVFFCGEATSSVAPTTVAGAYESGLRAASEVAALLALG